MDKNAPIGIIDSGVGGLTVARAIRRALPFEDLIYLGDSANCPYGNRPAGEIMELALHSIAWLEERGVKAIALACNTSSTMIAELAARCHVPLVGTILPVVEHIASLGTDRVGLVATRFTVESGCYQRLLGRHGVGVAAAPLPNLAGIIDSGVVEGPLIEGEISSALPVMGYGAVRYIVLGCTHYPLALPLFERLFPQSGFIDPAQWQAQAVRSRLEERDALKTSGHGRLSVCSTGQIWPFERFLYRIDLPYDTLRSISGRC